jgi:hypothetical protein
MSPKIRALIVVLTVATTIFVLAKPIALRFMSMEDFSRRRLVWFVLTTVCFLSPNIWLYALVAVPMLVWANRKDSNPIALYLLMLHVAPPVSVAIPLLGNNGLFDLDNYRFLAFCVLLPAAIRYRKNEGARVASVFGGMDVLLLAFGALQVALYVAPDLPHQAMIPDSPTNLLRRAFLYLLDVYLLYFAVSRICQSRQQVLEAAAGFCLGCAVMAPLALFERTRNWLLFVDIASDWSDSNLSFYLSRGGSVRAQVSSGHSIALGYLLAIAFGLWLGLEASLQKRMQRIGGKLLYWAGLFGAYSRGGWLGGAVVFFTFNAVGPRALSRIVKGAGAALAVGAIILASPLGDGILELLPKSGQPADEYRHRLAERGWEVALAHPFFGDQYPWPKMEDLRQGEGIIDIVNTYLGVALTYGLVGLFLFVGFILLGMMKTYVRARELTQSDPAFALFGASLIACIVGTLVMIDSSSFNLGSEKMFYVLGGLAAAYARARLTESPPHDPTALSARSPLQD